MPPPPERLGSRPAQSSAFTIRQAATTDAAAISELGTQVFAATFAHAVEPHDLRAFLEQSYSTTASAADLGDAMKDVIVATDVDGQIAGFAYLTRGSGEPPCVGHVPDRAKLQRVYVRTSAHGKGVGRLLATTVEAMARDQGFKNIWLGVWEENKNAIAAYTKWGYQRVGDQDFVIGSVVRMDHIMLKGV
jgi:ribosomal protein S18 acetylase RimI-like enzyme